MNIKRMLLGAFGGLAGSLGMHLFRIAWEHTTSHRAEDGIFGFDHEADVNSARLAAALFRECSLKESCAANVGMGLHYAYGSALGVACSCLLHEIDSPLLLGSMLWLIADEIPISLCTISNPIRKSVASHTGAFLSHYVYAAIFVRVTEESRG